LGCKQFVGPCSDTGISVTYPEPRESVTKPKEPLNKCGADTPVRVKAGIVHTFRHQQI